MSDNDTEFPSPTPPHRRVVWWLLAAVVVIAAALAWKLWPASGADPDAASETVDLSPEALDARLLQTESAISSVRRAQESANQRLTDTSARTGLLRDEVLGISQRAALVEDSVRELASTRSDGVAALRMDEAELLLTMAAERLQLAHDVPGAIRATELADGVLSALRDPALLNLRQTLAQELAALRAMPKDPRALAAGELDALEAVLPRISTNVSVYANEPDADPLRLFLASLERMRALPPDTLVLPSHGRPFRGLHQRLDQLQAHHASHLDTVLAACQRAPQSAADILPLLFTRALDAHQSTFAMGEALAHLHLLWHAGQLQRHTDSEGVLRFAPAA